MIAASCSQRFLTRPDVARTLPDDSLPLLARASDLLAYPPTIEPVDVLASKLPA